MAIEGHGPIAVIGMWGNGFWDLLAFSMQMLLVLVTGFMLASTPPVKRVLVALARCVKSPGAAILTVSVVSLIAHWINWGFGLIVSVMSGCQSIQTARRQPVRQHRQIVHEAVASLPPPETVPVTVSWLAGAAPR